MTCMQVWLGYCQIFGIYSNTYPYDRERMAPFVTG